MTTQRTSTVAKGIYNISHEGMTTHCAVKDVEDNEWDLFAGAYEEDEDGIYQMRYIGRYGKLNHAKRFAAILAAD